MESSKSFDAFESFEDGKIAIFKRKGLKSPVYQARIRIPEQSGYIQKTTKTTNRDEAYRFAYKMYDDARIKAASGEQLTSKRISKVIEEYLSQRNIAKNQYLKLLYGKYLIDFAGKKPISFLNAETVEQFLTYREEQSPRQTLTSRTLNHDAKELVRFFKFCVCPSSGIYGQTVA